MRPAPRSVSPVAWLLWRAAIQYWAAWALSPVSKRRQARVWAMSAASVCRRFWVVAVWWPVSRRSVTVARCSRRSRVVCGWWAGSAEASCCVVAWRMSTRSPGAGVLGWRGVWGAGGGPGGGQCGQGGGGDGEEGAAVHGSQGLSQGGHGGVVAEGDDARCGQRQPAGPGLVDDPCGQGEGLGEVGLGVLVGLGAAFPLADTGGVGARAQAAARGGGPHAGRELLL